MYHWILYVSLNQSSKKCWRNSTKSWVISEHSRPKLSVSLCHSNTAPTPLDSLLYLGKPAWVVLVSWLSADPCWLWLCCDYSAAVPGQLAGWLVLTAARLHRGGAELHKAALHASPSCSTQTYINPASTVLYNYLYTPKNLGAWQETVGFIKN